MDLLVNTEVVLHIPMVGEYIQYENFALAVNKKLFYIYAYVDTIHMII